MNEVDLLFEQLAAELSAAGAQAGTLFGKRAVSINGKAFLCLKEDSLAFRLGAKTSEHAAALALDSAELFDPSGKKRPFKDWVAISFSQAQHWPYFAHAAVKNTVKLSEE